MFDHILPVSTQPRRRAVRPAAGTLALLALIATSCGESLTPPPGPTQLVVSSVTVTPDADTLVALGAFVQLTAEARDQNGATMLGQTYTWTSSSESIAAVDANGLVTAVTEGEATIEASVSGVIGEATVVVEQQPAGLVFRQEPSDARAGQAIAPEVVVEVRDAEGNVVTGGDDSVTIALASNPGGGALSGRRTIALAGGVASFKDLSIEKAGVDYTLVATVSGDSATSAAFSIVAGPAVTLEFLDQPTDTEANQPLSPIRVASVDEFGNTAPSGDPVTVFIKVNPGTGVLSGTTTVKPIAGVATFPNLEIDATGVDYQLKALAGSMESPESDPFDVTLTFISVSAGGHHTCGVTIANDGYCWGSNGRGQLGHAKLPRSDVPVLIVGGPFIAVQAGNGHSCGVSLKGEALCWGDAQDGKLGTGIVVGDNPTPTRVVGSQLYESVSPGTHHTCGVTVKNEAYCWGYNNHGQLGIDNTMDSPVPVRVLTPNRFVSVSALAGHSCGTDAAMQVLCWGDNGRGQVGDGTTDDGLTPVPVAGGLLFGFVAAGDEYSCGLTTAGQGYCWGDNGRGQLGDPGLTGSLTPTPVSGNHLFETISLGDFHLCGVTVAGEGYCWGENAQGQLGDDTTSPRGVPTLVAGTTVWQAIDAGLSHSCGVTPDGDVYCWGRNNNGQLGDGSMTDRLTPVRIVQ